MSCLRRCECAPAACVNDVPLERWSAADIVAAGRGASHSRQTSRRKRRRWPTDPYATRDGHYGVLRRILVGATGATDPRGVEGREPPGMGRGFPTGLKWQLVRDVGNQE